MDHQRWKQVEDLLQAVLDHAAGERDAFLRPACAGDQALEREVRSLLTLEQQAAGFLEIPAMEGAARALARGERADAAEAAGSLIGRSISRYRIVENLGG